MEFLGDLPRAAAFTDQSEYLKLTVGKSGPKLTPTQLKGPLPGIGMQPGKNGPMFVLRNATIPDFTGFLQLLVLGRPVVDQTGLTERYDFTVTFTPISCFEKSNA